ncbi:carbamoyl-phosphate synthase small chain, chloroplastic-like protein isoform X2 [Tanacetum coccineum]
MRRRYPQNETLKDYQTEFQHRHPGNLKHYVSSPLLRLLRHPVADARLVLEDGSIWKAKSFGASRAQLGEVVYQEILIDPSYAGQFVLMTCPHIDNIGVNIDYEESIKCFLAGLVIRSLSIRL